MKRVVLTVLLSLYLVQTLSAATDEPGFWQSVRSSIEKNLGRPYVWGAAGLKSFDCSGFIWRVMYDNGILLKRTTARKFYMTLPSVPPAQQWDFGTLVFFDDLKHVGIVDDATAFYHAQVTFGTNRSPMNSFWRKKVYGFRRLPLPAAP